MPLLLLSRFLPEVYNGCHDFKDVAIVTVKGNKYRILFLYMSKDEAINLLRNGNLTENSRLLTQKFFTTYKDG